MSSPHPILSSSHLESHFYFNRIPKLWNRLPPLDLTLSPTSIKQVILKFLWSQFTQHFSSDNSCTYHFFCPCNKCSAIPSASFRPSWSLFMHAIHFTPRETMLILFVCFSFWVTQPVWNSLQCAPSTNQNAHFINYLCKLCMLRNYNLFAVANRPVTVDIQQN